jgi:hypothetical protein
MQDFIDDIKKGIIKDLEQATKNVLIKNKVDRDSDLIKSLQWDFKQGHFVLVANDYYQYVDAGRRRGSFPPIKDILQWMKDNQIRPRSTKITMNQLAFLIARSIKLNGIKPKKYSDIVVDVSTDIIAEQLAEDLSEIIVDEIVQSIEN